MSMKHFNGLTPAEAERLALLCEELGEAQQAIGKILRHGYASHNPCAPMHKGNRADLEKELGHIAAAIELMVQNSDILESNVHAAENKKLETIPLWLHHQ